MKGRGRKDMLKRKIKLLQFMEPLFDLEFLVNIFRITIYILGRKERSIDQAHIYLLLLLHRMK